MIKKLKNLPWGGLSAAVCSLVFGSLTADGIEGNILFKGWFDALSLSGFFGAERLFLWQALTTLTSLLCFLLCLVLLYKHRSEFQAVRGLTKSVNGESHACLIMFLSPPNKEIVEVSCSPFRISVDGIQMPTDLDDDINLCKWNWQQFLRGVRLHRKDLKTVYLVGSQDAGGKPGSFGFRDHARGLLQHYFPDAEIHCHDKALNFEEFDELAECLTDIIEHFKKEGYRDKDIVIDVTGGQKTTSIAGAVVTLNKKVTFQYVQTNEPNDVLTYDVEFLSPAGL